MTNLSIRDAALGYVEAGLSVIPTDKDKLPVKGLLPHDANGKPTWKPYQSQIADADTIRRFFANGANIAIVTGVVSGGLGAIDFDDPRFYDAWRAEVGSLAHTLVIQKTGDGYHVLFRCPNPGHSQKLAWVADETEESGRRVAIETRAEGGYILAAPSLHGETGRRYEVIAGDLTAIPTISQAHADALLEAARKLDECPYTRQQLEAQAKREAQAKDRPRPKDGESVIDAYNQVTPIESALERHGYRVKGTRAIRPGGEKTSVKILDGKSFHHNSNDPLSDGYRHSAFDIFCQLDHAGNVKAAVKAAAQELGMSYKTDKRSPAKDQTQTDHESQTESHPFTDMGNGQRLAERHGDKLRHIHQWGYLVWDERRWECDETGAVMRLAKETTLSIFDEAQPFIDLIRAAADDLKKAAAFSDEEAIEKAEEMNEAAAEKKEQIQKWALACQALKRLEAMIELAASEPGIAARHTEFDAHPYLLNCQNGTLDLCTGELRPHDPADSLTRITSASFDQTATCPTWLSFLDCVFDHDTELIEFIRRAIGYTLTGDTREQCLFFMYGTGKNGKSTFAEVLLSLVGDYGRKTPAETLLAKRNDGELRNDVAALAGRRLVVAAELPEGRRLNEALTKDLTGGDTIAARFLYKEFFEFRPQFKLWLYGNHKPVIRGTDEGIWRRIRLIPFTVTIAENERDPDLPNKLRAELPGILAWAMGGSLAWQTHGLPSPTKVKTATNDYRAEQDVLAAFIAECCFVKSSAEVKAGDLYAAYKSYAEQEAVSQKAFAMRLHSLGLTPHKGTGGARIWRGLGLLADSTSGG